MDKSDVQEQLVTLYLRLNGYLTSGFIAHDVAQNLGEVDILAVRFPWNSEQEREIGRSAVLEIPTGKIDFIIGEVKSGRPYFNPSLRSPIMLKKVLNWLGALDADEIERIAQAACNDLDPAQIRSKGVQPEYSVCGDAARLRFKLFAPELSRKEQGTLPYVFGNDMFEFLWSCFRPASPRSGCADRYDFGLWGPLEPVARYFKDRQRSDPGTLEALYASLNAT